MNAWREIERKTKILGTCQDAESGSSWLVPENPVLNPPFAHTYTYRRTHNHETNTIYRFIQLDTCYTIDNMYTYIHLIFQTRWIISVSLLRLILILIWRKGALFVHVDAICVHVKCIRIKKYSKLYLYERGRFYQTIQIKNNISISVSALHRIKTDHWQQAHCFSIINDASFHFNKFNHNNCPTVLELSLVNLFFKCPDCVLN